ncbi:MAG: hypothetical protein J6Y48_16010 [Clostridia bacterium]|nr:hypothetical protein [Clostridia bacterium]
MNPYNIYPATYHNPYLQQQNNSIIWVQGEAGAKSYLVAPNNTVQLWDSESQVIYLKSADASGMPSMRILDYTIRNAPADAHKPDEQQKQYVTREELDALTEQINGLKTKMDKIRKVKDDE